MMEFIHGKAQSGMVKGLLYESSLLPLTMKYIEIASVLVRSFKN